MAWKAASLRGSARPVPVRAASTSARATRWARILPSFLIIGAQRAGTTSFFYDLSRHPEVAHPVGKELHFFNYEFRRGTSWYRSFFPTVAARRRARLSGRDLIAGEATPYYLFHPAVPGRVAEMLPDARLIVLLRNPVNRAYSHYQKMRRMGFEWLSFEKAVDVEDNRLAGDEERLLADSRYRSDHHRRHSYISRGLYAEQLERWFAHFPRDRFLFLLAEDFFARPSEVYAETLDFLGLAPHPLPERRVREAPAYEPLDPGLRARLEQRFATPNARLALLLGRELWSTPQPLEQSDVRAAGLSR